MNRIILDGADNARDLGGLTSEDGRQIKPRRLIRSNQLNGLTARDREILQNEYHVEVMIDLRTSEEIREQPDAALKNAEWIHIPVFEQRLLGITHEETNGRGLADLPDLSTLYQMMMSNPSCVGQIKKVFRVLATKRDGAVLWHCTEGKDRCGVVSALVLYALGVPEKSIAEDYLYTNVASQKRADMYYHKTLQSTADEKLADKVRRMFVADELYLKAAMDVIAEQYGSVKSFLENVLELDLQSFRALYLEEAEQ